MNSQPRLIACGVDAGQTSTRALMLDGPDAAGRIQVGVGSSHGVIHTSTDGGQEQLIASILAAFQQAKRACAANACPDREDNASFQLCIVIGASGVADATSPEAADTRAGLEAAWQELGVNSPMIVVTSDAHTALYGAHNGAPGLLAIAGTGSIVLGINEAGDEVRTGGWGWLVDDAGSGFAIGRDGLRAAVRAADGMGAPTILEERIQQEFAVASMFDLKHVVYASEFGARGFAALAPLVSYAAREGDLIAQQIIDAAAGALAATITAAARRLHSARPGSAPDSWPVALHGGAFEHIAGLRTGVTERLGETLTVVDAKMPPLLGAAAMALELDHVGPDRPTSQFQATLNAIRAEEQF